MGNKPGIYELVIRTGRLPAELNYLNRDIMAMLERLHDDSLGLVLRGNLLVPNEELLTLISVYTADIVEAVLSENVTILQKWLDKLHAEYITAKRACNTESDSIACYNMTGYDEFERKYASWQDGGLIEISLPTGNGIWVRKSADAQTSKAEPTHFVCKKCGTAFKSAEELDAHVKLEKQTKPIEKGYKLRSRDGIPPNPIWWPAES